MLVDALRRDRVKALALRRQIGQPGATLETGEGQERQAADEQPDDPPGERSAQQVSDWSRYLRHFSGSGENDAVCAS